MSNIIVKDRRFFGDDLVVLKYIQEIVAETSHIVHNPNKIPKRKVDCIGRRLVDHAFAACEAARNANVIVAQNSKDQQRREQLAYKAECELGGLLADVYLLPSIIHESKDKQWYKEWRNRVTKIYCMTASWRYSEEEKLAEFRSKDKNESLEKQLKVLEIKEKRKAEQKQQKQNQNQKQNIGVAINGDASGYNINNAYDNPNNNRVIKIPFHFEPCTQESSPVIEIPKTSCCNSELLSNL